MQTPCKKAMRLAQSMLTQYAPIPHRSGLNTQRNSYIESDEYNADEAAVIQLTITDQYAAGYNCCTVAHLDAGRSRHLANNCGAYYWSNISAINCKQQRYFCRTFDACATAFFCPRSSYTG